MGRRYKQTPKEVAAQAERTRKLKEKTTDPTKWGGRTVTGMSRSALRANLSTARAVANAAGNPDYAKAIGVRAMLLRQLLLGPPDGEIEDGFDKGLDFETLMSKGNFNLGGVWKSQCVIGNAGEWAAARKRYKDWNPAEEEQQVIAGSLYFPRSSTHPAGPDRPLDDAYTWKGTPIIELNKGELFTILQELDSEAVRLNITWHEQHSRIPQLRALEIRALVIGTLSGIQDGPNGGLTDTTVWSLLGQRNRRVATPSEWKTARERWAKTHTPTTNTPTQETNTMSEEKSTTAIITSALKRGAAMGVIGTVNRKTVLGIESKLGDNYPEALKSEAGRKAMEVALPSLVLAALPYLEEKGLAPGAAYIEQAATMAVEDAARDGAAQLAEVLMIMLMPVFEEYRTAGKMLAEDLVEVTDFGEAVKTKRKRKVKATVS